MKFLDRSVSPPDSVSRNTDEKITQSVLKGWCLNRSLGEVAHDWKVEEVRRLLDLPFKDLLFFAQMVHRINFSSNDVQVSTLCNIKTGSCAEDCAYCSQSSRYDTGVKKERMIPVEEVLAQAQVAKDSGATRFCMGAAWRSPNTRQLKDVVEMVKGVKKIGLEACATLGMLDTQQASELAEAGLDYYNHNLDTSEAYYPKVITTRTFQDRLDTLENVRRVGMKVCSGGIIGLGENHGDRAELLCVFATMKHHPESVPINLLVPIKGTPMYERDKVDPIEFVRVIAVARIVMPRSRVRLSAGRAEMSQETQALCFLAGANSIFYGEKLLTTGNPDVEEDRELFAKLGLQVMQSEVTDLSDYHTQEQG